MTSSGNTIADADDIRDVFNEGTETCMGCEEEIPVDDLIPVDYDRRVCSVCIETESINYFCVTCTGDFNCLGVAFICPCCGSFELSSVAHVKLEQLDKRSIFLKKIQTVKS